MIKAVKRVIRKVLFCYRKTDGWRKRQVNKYLRENDVAKLQIGCGPFPLEGWFNTDVLTNLHKGSPIYMDAGKPFPMPDASFDYVYSEHLFEHLTYPQATNMLKECYRILKPNGVLRMATPNLQFLVNLYLHPEEEINHKYIEFNTQMSGLPSSPVYTVNYFHTTWGHKIIYDPETLSNFLRENGFKDICQCEMSKSSHSPLNNVEQHFKFLQYDLNLLETMIIEARR